MHTTIIIKYNNYLLENRIHEYEIFLMFMLMKT